MAARIIFVVLIAFSIGAIGATFLRSDQGGSTTSSGQALIGGPFTLTNHEGQTVTEQDFRGRYMLVAFGFTYCPDICPAELNVISSAMDKLGDEAKAITPLFITIDPKRDTVEQMANYVSSFHPSLVGLTGTPEQIKKAASAYRVYYAKASVDDSDDEAYLMDHSTFIYLMDPNGDYVTHFSYGISAEQLAERISQVISEPTV